MCAVEILTLVVGLALTVLAVTTLSNRWGLSAPLVLIVVGLVGSYLPFIQKPTLSPELVLVGILPPLLYTAAHNTSLMDFRDNLSAIGWLSIGLVLFTTAGIGLLAWALLPLPFAAAFALGAIVAPPDAVAATAVAKQIGLPRRVVTILEGESLVNDATALVSLRTATGALTAAVTVGAVLLDFAKAVVIAVVVGVVVAKAASYVLRRTSDPVATTALSFLLPFIAFAPAEHFHASGVLSVVVAGLLIGHMAPVVETAQSRVTTRINWKTITYLLENSVFLLVGLQTRSIVSAASSSPLGWGRIIAACLLVLLGVMLLRVVWIMATRFVVRVRQRQGVTPWQESALISWAGMRGVVTLAAALTLPLATPHRAVLVLIALVVTAGTLLIQGLTLPVLARRLDVHGPDPREDALQEATVYARAVEAGRRAMEREAGPDDAATIATLRDQTERRVNAIWERLGRPDDQKETPSQTYRRLRTAAIKAEREEVLRVRSEGEVESEVISAVLASLDFEETSLMRVEQRVRRLRALSPALPDAPCEHLEQSPTFVEPRTHGECIGCQAEGTTPVHMRLCLTCGYVGCCDSSEGRHATRHYEATGHPTMRSFEPGESWRWCFVDGLLASGY
ncbi:Na+/H+ antiporter [Arsenicicoccus sp. MKL-02]|uniref:Na+/H+ antiporter n=1 Tax=Arsenicicoccus cauae TaxID=2663847 RepID=A0A6I3II61_9MICO|nr:Na+/H+ antiporter [Arsenicicoccus cauae]